jgi:hypothetical protein
LIGLIRKRHDGDGWFVFDELQNGTGGRYTGRADALALGLWPSHGFKLHGYEIKESREDLKKELRDPQKADNFAKYCHMWWLCVRDVKLMDGLVLPDNWGVLIPKGGVLRTHRKATIKADPKPLDAAFVASMIRKVSKEYVPRSEHNAYIENAEKLAREKVQQDRKYQHSEAEHDLTMLKTSLKQFESESGVRLFSEESRWSLNQWQMGNIGKAVKAIIEARDVIGHRRHEDPIEMVQREASRLEHQAESHVTAAAESRAAAARVRQLLERLMTDGKPELDASAPNAEPSVG